MVFDIHYTTNVSKISFTKTLQVNAKGLGIVWLPGL